MIIPQTRYEVIGRRVIRIGVCVLCGADVILRSPINNLPKNRMCQVCAKRRGK